MEKEIFLAIDQSFGDRDLDDVILLALSKFPSSVKEIFLTMVEEFDLGDDEIPNETLKIFMDKGLNINDPNVAAFFITRADWSLKIFFENGGRAPENIVEMIMCSKKNNNEEIYEMFDVLTKYGISFEIPSEMNRNLIIEEVTAVSSVYHSLPLPLIPLSLTPFQSLIFSHIAEKNQ